MTTWRNRIVGHGEADPEQLLANPLNWRIHPKAQQDALAGVLDEVGWVQSVTVNQRTGFVVDGHLRVALALRREEKAVPVVYVDLSPEEEAEVLATLDPIGALAVADAAKLDELLQDVQSGSAAVQAMIAELAEKAGCEYGQAEESDAEPQLDRAAELQAVWQVESGDLWQIGEHRLLCGDSTNAADVERVMGGEKADCVLTDPPYGQNQPGVPGDDPADLPRLITAAVDRLPCTDAVVVAFQSPRTFPVWLDAIRAAGYKFERMLWLYKQAQEKTFPWRGWLLLSDAILISAIGKAQWQDIHPYSHDCYMVQQIKEVIDGGGKHNHGPMWHGSIKPLAVVSDLMQRTSPMGGIVYDPFLGSGTTLVACQNLGRKGRGIEIEPKYCAVTLQRMQDAFPQLEIRRLNHGGTNGEPAART